MILQPFQVFRLRSLVGLKDHMQSFKGLKDSMPSFEGLKDPSKGGGNISINKRIVQSLALHMIIGKDYECAILDRDEGSHAFLQPFEVLFHKPS